VGEERGDPAEVLNRRALPKRPLIVPARPSLRWLGQHSLTIILTVIFEEKIMATITIKDLPENLDLDRKAMQSIMGGSRLRSSSGYQVRRAGAGPARSPRIVDFNTGAAPGGAPGKQTG
jgi:hypothetical protein